MSQRRLLVLWRNTSACGSEEEQQKESVKSPGLINSRVMCLLGKHDVLSLGPHQPYKKLVAMVHVFILMLKS